MKSVKNYTIIFFTIFLCQCSSYKTITTEYYTTLGLEASKELTGRIEQLSLSGNSYNFISLRAFLGANNAILYGEENVGIINYQQSIIDNLMHTAQPSKAITPNDSPYKDGYLGWTSKRDNGTKNLEVPLYESYPAFYIAQFLHLSLDSDWYKCSRSNQNWWNKALQFLETHMWTKWYERCKPVKGNHYWYFLRGRTHMGSHWAGVAMYLNRLSKNEQIKEQAENLIHQYDTLLKRNLKTKGRSYVWNATYDDVSGTDASSVDQSIVQDVSHGNHVVSYIIAAYELGNPEWTLDDIHKLAFTLVDNVYDPSSNLSLIHI